MKLSATQQRNYRIARNVFDEWFEGRSGSREAWWLRLVAALHTESGCLVLAHDGVWGGGGKINAEQSRLLRTSLDLPHDAIGHNGGSVGALQQIPTPVARAADKPWSGWGTIADCMDLRTSIPKFLAELNVTTDPVYKTKKTADPVVADLLRVQQPLASEVSANYGAEVIAAAREIAAQFPRGAEKQAPAIELDWIDMATAPEVKEAFGSALAQRAGLGIVRDESSGWEYAVGQGTFRAVQPPTVAAGRKVGLVNNSDTVVVPQSVVLGLRDLAGDPKASGVAFLNGKGALEFK